MSDGIFALANYTLSLVAGNISYIREGGTFYPNGAIQSITAGAQHTITLYGTIDWDYGGLGSSVNLTDIILVLIKDIVTGGAGVTITINRFIFKSSDEGATAEVDRNFTLSSGDSLIIAGNFALYPAGENYSANLKLYLRGGSVAYSGTPTLYANGGPHIGFGYSQIYNLDTDNILHFYGIEVSGGQLYLGGTPYGTIQIDNGIQVDTLTELFFAYNPIIIGTDTNAGTITNNGSIAPLCNASNQTSIRSASSSYPAIVTGNSIDWDYSGAQTVYIQDLDIQSAQITGGGGVTIELTGDISIADFTINSGDTFNAGNHIVIQSGNLIVSGVLDTGTGIWKFVGIDQDVIPSALLTFNDVIIDSTVEAENTTIGGDVTITSGYLSIKNYAGTTGDYKVWGTMNWSSPTTYPITSNAIPENGIDLYVMNPTTGTTLFTFETDNIGLNAIDVAKDTTIRVTDNTDVYTRAYTLNGTQDTSSGYGGAIHTAGSPWEFTPADFLHQRDSPIDIGKRVGDEL